ncbi:MAG: MCE family protein, partial [Verrucomicrobiaceae bacterium]
MSTERKGTEVFVGLFLFIGFAFIAIMVVLFGRVSMGGKDTYQVTVEFPNASGIVKGSDVLLAGARIGTVAEAPAPPV